LTHKVTVEEFEQGAWVAEIESIDPVTGSFELAGKTWVGSVVAERNENGVRCATIVGGRGGLNVAIGDRYYDGRTTYAEIVRAIAQSAGERVGSVRSGSTQTYMRLRGTAGETLQRFCETYGLQWWIDRSGLLQVGARPSGSDSLGVRVESYPDGAVSLINPERVTIGGTYDGRTIKHVRWCQDADRFEALLYFKAIAPAELDQAIDYRVLQQARVDRQHEDGTIDVIVSGRFAVTNVTFLSGIPDSQLQLLGGDLVTLGFYNGDPRAPFAMGTGQSQTEKARVAREGDSVDCGWIVYVPGAPGSLTYIGPEGPEPPPGPTVSAIRGIISSGNTRVKI
jgi:hypothetical protein